MPENAGDRSSRSGYRSPVAIALVFSLALAASVLSGLAILLAARGGGASAAAELEMS